MQPELDLMLSMALTTSVLLLLFFGSDGCFLLRDSLGIVLLYIISPKENNLEVEFGQVLLQLFP
jgi:hypothetical protein